MRRGVTCVKLCVIVLGSMTPLMLITMGIGYRQEAQLPLRNRAPSLGVNPFEFLDDFFIPKTRVLGLSVGEDFVILACVVFTQCQRVTDGRTDGQTDGRTDRHSDRS